MEIEVVFKNELDIQIFDYEFYKKLDNITQVKAQKQKIENRTCACLDTSRLS